MNQQVIGKYRWTICALLFFATTVNYLDRQVLSLLAPALSKEFGWSNSDYANITAVFQFVYAISMLFAGRFIDAIGTKRAFDQIRRTFRPRTRCSDDKATLMSILAAFPDRVGRRRSDARQQKRRRTPRRARPLQIQHAAPLADHLHLPAVRQLHELRDLALQSAQEFDQLFGCEHRGITGIETLQV